ncbi:hypothetical protein TNCV_1714291 [Trichonephila clavipes]|nr:hypothetical protein TNCV_1714291 [Trichonephila clavipes]
MPADDSVVTEMVAEHLFHTAGDVWRSTILHKHCGCMPSPCLKIGRTECSNNEAYSLTVMVYVTGPMLLYFSNNNGSTMKVAVKPHQTVLNEDYNGL